MSILKKRIEQVLIITLLVCAAFFAPAQTPPAREYQIKAAFLFNFSQFVNWPVSSFSSVNAPLVICILGEDPFGIYLKELVSGEKVNEHPLTIYNYKKSEDIKTCHILFINKAEINNLKNILESIKGRNILTVSDAPDFLQQGGMVRFFTKNNKIQIQINLDAAKNAKLDISSKLLRLAEIFVPK